ncbi:MAG: tetratricopeptide repeat protein [Caldilineaceae bacterium]
MNDSIAFEESEEFRQTLAQSARFLAENRPEEALRMLLPLHAKVPKHPDVAINLGGAYILQRKWNRAVRVLEVASEANPQNVMLWLNLGAAQLGRLELSGPKQQAEAIRSFQRALEVDPSTPNAHYQIALIYKEQGNLPLALKYFEQALAVQPYDRDASYWLEKIRLRMASSGSA